MVVVAIIGVLAAVSISAYRTNVIRARLGNAIAFGAPFKSRVAETVSDLGRLMILPEDVEDTEYTVIDPASFIHRVRWSRSRKALEIWMGTAAGPELAGKIVWLVPTLEPGGTLSWRCQNHSDAPYKLLEKYLPSSCRS